MRGGRPASEERGQAVGWGGGRRRRRKRPYLQAGPACSPWTCCLVALVPPRCSEGGARKHTVSCSATRWNRPPTASAGGPPCCTHPCAPAPRAWAWACCLLRLCLCAPRAAGAPAYLGSRGRGYSWGAPAAAARRSLFFFLLSSKIFVLQVDYGTRRLLQITRPRVAPGPSCRSVPNT
jgi:hypothetical protein